MKLAKDSCCMRLLPLLPQGEQHPLLSGPEDIFHGGGVADSTPAVNMALNKMSCMRRWTMGLVHVGISSLLVAAVKQFALRWDLAIAMIFFLSAWCGTLQALLRSTAGEIGRRSAACDLAGSSLENKLELIRRVCPASIFESPGPEDLCVICLEAMHNHEPRRVLYCYHYFHAQCIQKWWLHQAGDVALSCPLCKQIQPVHVSTARV